jgi:DNA (cytosine-5)-methyltransferase 1
MSKLNNWPTAVDLFCGCGAVTEALKRHHFRVVAAVDNDPIACNTYRRNHPSVRLYEREISRVSPHEIRTELLDNKNLDLLVVCAPCQPFSSQGQKNSDDTRTRLILRAVRYASILKPKLILFENVPGLATPRFANILKELKRCLVEIDYKVGNPENADAADYGVPQRRERCILLASRFRKPPSLPPPVTPVGERISVRRAIGNLRRLESGEKDVNDPLHFARRHQTITLRRLSYVPKNGGSRASLPKNLVLKCHKNHSGHPDVYGRMSWEDVAPTLTTGCTDVTKGRFAHPDNDRAITLREAARLQTFDDSYRFEGNASEIAIQIGNAVPVRLIEEIVPVFRTKLR